MDTDTDASNKEIIFTDIDLEPITCDINAAHFDGFLYEIADFCQRTGKFLPLLTQGITIRGYRTVIDSPAAIPFIQGGITNSREYDAFDPCPPTDKRISDHNKQMALTGSPLIQGRTKVSPTDSDYIVNNFLVQ